jgi:hypothetical protein
MLAVNEISAIVFSKYFVNPRQALIFAVSAPFYHTGEPKLISKFIIFINKSFYHLLIIVNTI